MSGFSKDKLAELLVGLREKHGADFVSMSDLTHPTSEFMMRYFATVLGQLGFDIKGMYNCELTDSDSYKDISPVFQVCMTVKKVCPEPKYFDNFDVLTLMEPKPDDVFYVAAMDNFYDFYFQRITDLYHPRQEEEQSLKRLLQEHLNRMTELQHELNDRAAASSKREMEQAQIEREIEKLDGELRDLHPQKKLLEEERAGQQKALKELLVEVDCLRNRCEQLKELQENQAELKTLREELQQLHSRQAAQDQELAEKRSALQEKASRQRFQEECIVLESQATESAAELVEVASQVEKQRARSLKESTNTEHGLRELEAVMKKQSQLEDQKAALEQDNATQQKILAEAEKERKDLKRTIQDAEEENVRLQQNIISSENKSEDVNKLLQKKREERSLLNEEFEIEQSKLCEKAAILKKELLASLQS